MRHFQEKMKHRDGSDASFLILKQWDGSGVSFFGETVDITQKMEQRDGSDASFFGRMIDIIWKMEQWDGSGVSFFRGRVDIT